MGTNTGWDTVLRIYPKKNLEKGLCLPIILTGILIIMILRSSISPKEMIEIISSNIISSFPSIIGFILAGFAILIGCPNYDVTKELYQKNAKWGNSMFQRLSATFTFVIVILIFTFLVNYCVNLIVKANCPFIFTQGTKLFNYIICFTLIFMTIYSIWSLIHISINLFNYSQYINKKMSNKP